MLDAKGPHTAMVFAAGLGKRMQPITRATPKPLIRVGGKPLIDHTLDRLAEAGVERAVVNVHWLGEQIIDHLKFRTAPKILISDERDRLLDQGGGIRRALPLLGRDAFYICNTDAFWIEGASSNIRRLAAAWDPSVMDALLLVATTASSVGVDWLGDFTMDSLGRLHRREEHAVAPFVYSGVGILSPELFAAEERDIFPLSPFLFAAAKKGRLYGIRLDGLWMHVGAPEAISEAEIAISKSIL